MQFLQFPVFRHAFSALALLALVGCNQSPKPERESAEAETGKPIYVGYQGMINPWKVGIQTGAFEKATGRRIEWRKFNSGSEVITGMASGDIQIAVAGSSPIATAMSRGVEVQLFWILEAIRDNEALVVQNDSGINSIEELRGKTVGVPFASTTHYHLMVALEHHGIPGKDVKLLNLQPDAIMAAWSQKSIDAAFVWSPILNEIKKTGRVILTSGELADLGKPTFDGVIALKSFAGANPEFMNQFVQVIAQMDEDYRTNKDQWTPESPQVQAISQLTGAKPGDVSEVLAQYHFPDLEEQCSQAWLGGGASSALRDTSVFLKSQKKIATVHEDYSVFINDQFARHALEKTAATTQ